MVRSNSQNLIMVQYAVSTAPLERLCWPAADGVLTVANDWHFTHGLAVAIHQPAWGIVVAERCYVAHWNLFPYAK